jgi:hypothetical protein
VTPSMAPEDADDLVEAAKEAAVRRVQTEGPRVSQVAVIEPIKHSKHQRNWLKIEKQIRKWYAEYGYGPIRRYLEGKLERPPVFHRLKVLDAEFSTNDLDEILERILRDEKLMDGNKE